jgi:uncharacterized damage-inducible protein DinB
MTEQPERSALLGFLDAQRRSVLAIVEGLDEDAIRRLTVPSGWSPLGMIEHLASAERFWFQRIVAGRSGALAGQTADTTSAADDVLVAYRDECARSDAVVTSIELGARPVGDIPDDMSEEIRDVRTIVLHMIEETARHAGHLDIARELIDGRTGLGPR